MAIDLFLKVDGITGESADSKHKNWIDVTSFSWGAAQVGTMSSGSGGGSGKVAFNDLRVICTLDQGTPGLVKYCSSGKHIGQVQISACKAGGTQIEYSTIVLKDVIVTNATFGGEDSGIEAVSYSFQASQVEHHYWLQSRDGTRGAESQMGWDIKANRATA